MISRLFSALCNEDANGNVPLGKSCNRYWQCQGGYPRLQRCPAMLVFDKRSLRCVVPPTEDCEVPTTPAPGPDDIDNDEEENVPPARGPLQQQVSNRPQQLGQQGGQPTQQYLQSQRNQQIQQQQQQLLQQRHQDDGSGGNHFNLPPGAVPLPVRNNQQRPQQ